jgi:hypothetical protein
LHGLAWALPLSCLPYMYISSELVCRWLLVPHQSVPWPRPPGTSTQCLCFIRHYRIGTAQTSLWPRQLTRKLAVPDYIAIVPVSVANSTARPKCSTSASAHLPVPPRWLQPDVGDWATTNKQAVKRKPARLTCPGRGACSVPCKRAVRNPPPEPPVVLFAVGSPLLALFVLVGRKRWASSIKHYKRIAVFLFPLLGSSP